MHEMAKEDSSWFNQILTIADTGVISEAYIEEERRQ
jgi:hypothetical protein